MKGETQKALLKFTVDVINAISLQMSFSISGFWQDFDP